MLKQLAICGCSNSWHRFAWKSLQEKEPPKGAGKALIVDARATVPELVFIVEFSLFSPVASLVAANVKAVHDNFQRFLSEDDLLLAFIQIL